MKEAEAKTKRCPVGSQARPAIVHCLVGECMAWIWDSYVDVTPSGRTEYVQGTTEGSCGLCREQRGR